ncbi:MAG: hypothetical protein K6F80_05990 [Oscillospiraceae bacterium]|nr:hypothetical protein [Oscillospiraceae bacterium]
MKKDFISALLAQDDVLTAERIAEEFSPQIDMERIFQRSMEKYHGTAVRRTFRSIQRRTLFRTLTAAACLLLTVGLGVGVWSKQQKIETGPPQHAQMPVMQTETESVETSLTTALQTTVKITETSRKQTETSVSSTDSVILVETQAVTETDAPVPHTTAVTVAQVLTETTDEARPTEPPATILQTEPVTAVQTLSRRNAPQTETVYIPAHQESATELPTTETQPQPETEAESFTQVDEELLTGFRLEQYADYRKVICTDSFPEPDGALQPYTILSEELVLLSSSAEEAAEHTYEIECPEAGKTFTVTQREYSEFVLTVEEGELINISLNRAHGFFHLQDETCSLYWFRNGEGFYVQCDVNDLEYLMKIARSFTPADTQ